MLIYQGKILLLKAGSYFFIALLFMLISGEVSMATTITMTKQKAQQTPLIPRKILFSNPEKASPALSPDGSKIAFLAPVNEVLNIFVAPVDNLAAAKALTHDKKRDIRGYFWTADGKYILYQQDNKGDENYHLYSIDLVTSKICDLTPFSDIQVRIIKSSMEHPEEILVGINHRNREWHDVYQLNVANGKLTLVEENNQFVDYIADENLHLRIAQRATADGGNDVYLKDYKGSWQLYEHVALEDALTTQFISLNKTGNIAYKLDCQNQDKAALYAYDFTTGKKKLIVENREADINDIMIHPTELVPQAWSSEYTKTTWTVLDKRIAKDFAYLTRAEKDIEDFEVVDRTLADDKWLVCYYSDTMPSQFYLYERDPKANLPVKLTFLFNSSQKLTNLPLVAMQPVIIKSRDGLNLISYLSLPYEASGSRRTRRQPMPLVLYVHGGPWARDSWGLNRIHQWLANRGYAVLSVNYRGSTGLGKAFINAGNGEWAGKMHDDLIDAVNWTIKNGIADPKKIAIMGGSYGGYATLVGLTFTPDIFTCGVSIVGPSNLITLINSVPPYWKPGIALFKTRIGDIDTAAGRKILQARSPLTYAERISKPLLILQGEHDPRVKKAEAEQIVKSAQTKSIPVTYVLYHDEGHGFVREPNKISANAIIEQFLAESLNGRAEGIKDDFVDADFSIVTGAEYIKGIKKIE